MWGKIQGVICVQFGGVLGVALRPEKEGSKVGFWTLFLVGRLGGGRMNGWICSVFATVGIWSRMVFYPLFITMPPLPNHYFCTTTHPGFEINFKLILSFLFCV